MLRRVGGLGAPELVRHDPGRNPAYEYGWGRQNWFSNNAEEHAAVREHVGVFEQSSFAKLLVQGAGAVQVLNRIATANVDVAIGRCVYTQFLNAAAGIEADLTITRLAADRFLGDHGSFHANARRGLDTQSNPAGAFCLVTDVSEAYAMLNVQGPASRALLQTLSTDDFSAAAFPFATCRRGAHRLSERTRASA